jgi:hypothetical protein
MAFPAGLIGQPLDGWLSTVNVAGGRFNGLFTDGLSQCKMMRRWLKPDGEAR